MSAISAMPGEIVAWLSSLEALESITFLTEYPSAKKAVPLRSTIVAVGIEEMTITDSFTENGQGVLVENEYCREASIKIKLSIHAPFSLGGEACHDAFTDILDCLTFASNLEITQSGCNGVTADRDTDAFVLHAWISISADFCPAASSSISFASFINKDLLCGSHITDASIHLSAAQQQYLTSPIVVGSYFGNGAATRNFNLGFAPKAVFICCGDAPFMQVNHAASANTTLAAMATTAGGSQGIDLTSTGFKTSSGSSFVLRDSTPNLNDAMTTYCYIAWR